MLINSFMAKANAKKRQEKAEKGKEKGEIPILKKLIALFLAVLLALTFFHNAYAEEDQPAVKGGEALPSSEISDIGLISSKQYYLHRYHRARDSLPDNLAVQAGITITNQNPTDITYDNFTIHFKIANNARIKIRKVGAIISDRTKCYYIYDSLENSGLSTSKTLGSSFGMKKYGVAVEEGMTYEIQPVIETANKGKVYGQSYKVNVPSRSSGNSAEFLFPLTRNEVWWPSTYVGHGKAYGAAYSAVDIVLANGKSCRGYDVYACADGVVVDVNAGNGQVTIRSDTALHTTNGKVYPSWYYQFAHTSNIAVKVGQYVRQGQVVAKVSDVGNATGPHLHFQIMSALNNSPWYSDSRDKAISPYYVPGFVDQNGGDLPFNKCDRQGTGVWNQLINWPPTGK